MGHRPPPFPLFFALKVPRPVGERLFTNPGVSPPHESETRRVIFPSQTMTPRPRPHYAHRLPSDARHSPPTGMSLRRTGSIRFTEVNSPRVFRSENVLPKISENPFFVCFLDHREDDLNLKGRIVRSRDGDTVCPCVWCVSVLVYPHTCVFVYV